MDTSPRLSGDEWQSWADKLLQRHYGPGEYQKIPDKHKGDAGIEGFTISTGHAYQAYGPVEPLSTNERYEKHRTKITNDIRKFIENRVILARIFGNVKISRWILLVPYYDSKEIVLHATKKTQDVINASLPYVSADFRVCIEDEEVFAVERDQLISARVSTISIDASDISQHKVTEWADKNDSLVETIEEKLQRLSQLDTEIKLRNFRDLLIKAYLDGQNTLEELRKYPTAYENIRTVKSLKERYLALNSMTSSGTNMDIFRNNLDDIRDTVKQEVPGVSKGIIEIVAYEAIADWIIRCPLDFPANH